MDAIRAGPLNSMASGWLWPPRKPVSEICGKNKRSRRADLRVGRDQIVLGLANIGAAFQQRRRKPGGQIGRRGDLFRLDLF